MISSIKLLVIELPSVGTELAAMCIFGRRIPKRAAIHHGFLSRGNRPFAPDQCAARDGELRKKIDKGLGASRIGIVVLSKPFFGKGWTNYELDGLVTRAVSGDQILLPIWHNVSKSEAVSYSASLADKVARNTTMHTVDEIAAEIVGVIRSHQLLHVR